MRCLPLDVFLQEQEKGKKYRSGIVIEFTRSDFPAVDGRVSLTLREAAVSPVPIYSLTSADMERSMSSINITSKKKDNLQHVLISILIPSETRPMVQISIVQHRPIIIIASSHDKKETAGSLCLALPSFPVLPYAYRTTSNG